MIDKTLASILAQIRDLASGLKEYDVVMAMPGVGNILGPRIIAEIGDTRRFHSGSALIAYAGLDAPPYQSGTFTGTNRHISKRGSSSLRKTGYEIIRFLKCVKPTTDTAVYDFLLKKDPGYKLPEIFKKALVHSHCQHKAVLKTDSEKEILTRMKLDFRMVDSGCCGMAGPFGFEKSNYDVSVKAGERVLLPEVRKAGQDEIIIADGFSCKEQIRQLTSKKALHIAEVIAGAINLSAGKK
jgi:hypothetical protein